MNGKEDNRAGERRRVRADEHPLWPFEQFVNGVAFDADNRVILTDWHRVAREQEARERAQRERERQARRRRAAVALLVGVVVVAVGYGVGVT